MRHFLAGCRAIPFEWTPDKRRSDRRLFQETWPINFEGFPASARATSNEEDGEAWVAATYRSRIKCCPGGAESIWTGVTPCPKRDPSSYSVAGFGRTSGKSKRRYALWDPGPRPERPGFKSVLAGWNLRRRQHFCSRNACERSVHGKDFSCAVSWHEFRLANFSATENCRCDLLTKADARRLRRGAGPLAANTQSHTYVSTRRAGRVW